MGLEHALKLIDIGNGDQIAPDFLAILPNNRIPTITDPNEPSPVSPFENGAILLFLDRKTAPFYGMTEWGRITIEQSLMWQMGSVGPATVSKRICGRQRQFHRRHVDLALGQPVEGTASGPA